MAEYVFRNFKSQLPPLTKAWDAMSLAERAPYLAEVRAHVEASKAAPAAPPTDRDQLVRSRELQDRLAASRKAADEALAKFTAVSDETAKAVDAADGTEAKVQAYEHAFAEYGKLNAWLADDTGRTMAPYLQVARDRIQDFRLTRDGTTADPQREAELMTLLSGVDLLAYNQPREHPRDQGLRYAVRDQLQGLVGPDAEPYSLAQKVGAMRGTLQLVEAGTRLGDPWRIRAQVEELLAPPSDSFQRDDLDQAPARSLVDEARRLYAGLQRVGGIMRVDELTD